MITGERKEYIKLSSNLLFNKYFYKLILEKKYIENFGDIELSKMRNIYETMIINRKLEENFSMANDDSVQFRNLVDYKARREFFDLERQIKELEENIKTNSNELKELEFYHNKGLGEAFEILVKKTSPFVNKSKKAQSIWQDFNLALSKENWKRIFRLASQAKELRVYKADLTEGELEAELERIKATEISLKNRYPFNQVEILEDEKNIRIKKDEERKDIQNMQESYLKMADIYLSTSSSPGWFS